MKRFTYTVSDPQGLHARNAISLSRLAGTFKSQILIHVQEKENRQKKADCKDILALMGLCVRQNITVEITMEGEDEETAFQSLMAAIPTIM